MNENELNIVCPFCNAPFTGSMQFDLSIAGGCETCGSDIEGSVDIYCSNCKKLVYKKEY